MEKYLQKIIANGTEFKINSPIVITWDSTSNMNDYVEPGIYELAGEKLSSEDNLPIINNGVVSGKLTVLVTDDGKGNTVVNQILHLNNNGGGEGNIYLRSKQFDVWRSWGKLQTNVEVNAIGVGQSKTFDDLTDNGMYSGVNVYWEDQSAYITGYETFVLVVINGYLTGAGISQLKYSTKTNGTTSVEIRNFNNNYWSEWSSLQSAKKPVIEGDSIAGAILGTSAYLGTNADEFHYSTTDRDGHIGIRIGSSLITDKWSNELNVNIPYTTMQSGGIRLGKRDVDLIIPLALGTFRSEDGTYWCSIYDGFKDCGKQIGVPIDENHFKLGTGGLTLRNPNNSTKITWDSSSNMNDFKIPGVYDIYGERTKQDDNLPILNANPGHSFSARLTVIASTLQPANNEICVTQFLMLSNRKGGDGNMYIRTYNENNSPTENGWTPWKKLSGSEEGYIFTNNRRLNQDWGLQTVEVGLNWMVDNGNYSGVYVNEEVILQRGDLDSNGNGWGEITTDLTKIKFIETFNITTINDYAVAGQVNDLLESLGMGSMKKDRQICQFKMATDLFSGTSSFQKRVYTGNDADYGNNDKWSEWQDISGGGSSEVDVTDLLQSSELQGYGLVGALKYGYIKKGITYSIQFRTNNDYSSTTLPLLDLSNKIRTHITSKLPALSTGGKLFIRLISEGNYNGISTPGCLLEIDAYLFGYEPSSNAPTPGTYYKYIINPGRMKSEYMTDPWEVSVSADMTAL